MWIQVAAHLAALLAASAQPPSAGARNAYPCYATTRDWKAWIETGSKTGKPELVVSGTVTTPSGNNRKTLVLGPKRGDPPEQVVDLQIKGIGNIATAVVETEEVRGRFPALPRYRGVIVTCNGGEIGRVERPEMKHLKRPAMRGFKAIH
jgi:hypothetical protein